MTLTQKINGTYKDLKKQVVFENSIDCLTYGYGFTYVNKLDLNEAEAKKVFDKARTFLARN